MAKTKGAKRPWTKAEDFYLTAHVGVKPMEDIRADLGRDAPDVEGRFSDLGLGELREKWELARRMRGFDTPSAGVVTMTAEKSIADDQRHGRLPHKVAEDAQKAGMLPHDTAPLPNYGRKLDGDVHRIF